MAKSALADRLRELRARRGFSLGELSARSGVAKSTLSRWEAGACLPDLAPLKATLKALAATTDEAVAVLSLLPVPRGVAALRRIDARGADLEGLGVPLPSLGETIRMRRLAMGLSSAQVGARVGVGERAVRSWEAGARRPDAVTCRALDDALGGGIAEISLGPTIVIEDADHLRRLLEGQQVLFRAGLVPQPELSFACTQAAWRLAQGSDEGRALLGHQLALNALAELERGAPAAGLAYARQAQELPWHRSPVELDSLAPYASMCGALIYGASGSLRKLDRILYTARHRHSERNDVWTWSAVVAARLGDERGAEEHLGQLRRRIESLAIPSGFYNLWHAEVRLDLGDPGPALDVQGLPDPGIYDFAGFRAALLIRAHARVGARRDAEGAAEGLLHLAKRRRALNPFQVSCLAHIGLPAPEIARSVFERADARSGLMQGA